MHGVRVAPSVAGCRAGHHTSQPWVPGVPALQHGSEAAPRWLLGAQQGPPQPCLPSIFLSLLHYRASWQDIQTPGYLLSTRWPHSTASQGEVRGTEAVGHPMPGFSHCTAPPARHQARPPSRNEICSCSTAGQAIASTDADSGMCSCPTASTGGGQQAPMTAWGRWFLPPPFSTASMEKN